MQYGVSNPHWFDKEYPSSTENYGPNDFVVETVNLDKNFFYQFFTSKPMIIDTDVVTSKSVAVNYADKNSNKGKRGRETLSNLPEHLVGNDILPEHILRKKMGEIQETIKKLVAEQEKDEKEGGEEEEEEHTSDLQLVNDRKLFVVTGIPNLETKLKFRRYQLPPEVRITSKVSMPKYEKRQSKANTPERPKEEKEEEVNEQENEVNDEHVFKMEEEALIM